MSSLIEVSDASDPVLPNKYWSGIDKFYLPLTPRVKSTLQLICVSATRSDPNRKSSLHIVPYSKYCRHISPPKRHTPGACVTTNGPLQNIFNQNEKTTLTSPSVTHKGDKCEWEKPDVDARDWLDGWILDALSMF